MSQKTTQIIKLTFFAALITTTLTACGPSRTGLTAAIVKGDREGMLKILKSGANVHEKDDYGASPLKEAVRRNNPELVTLLLANKANAKEADYLCDAISYSIYDRDAGLKIIKQLVAHGASTTAAKCFIPVTYPGRLGKQATWATPLSMAIEAKASGITEYLLSQPMNTDVSILPASFYAVMAGQWEVVDALSKIPGELDGALYAAIIKNNESKARQYIAQGANLNNPHMDMMVYAVINKNKNLIQTLSDKGYSGSAAKPRRINNHTYTLVEEAVLTGDYDIVKMVLLAGGNPNAGNLSNPLCQSFNKAKSLKIMNLLIASGADVNLYCEVTLGLENPLIRSTYSDEDLAYTRALLVAGANPNLPAKTNSHNYPIHASPRYSEKTIELLIGMGADVNVKDGSKHTPLHNAAYKNNAKIARMLLNAGADVNALDYLGDSPLDKTINYKGEVYKPDAHRVIKSYGGKAPDAEKRFRKKNDSFGKLFASIAIAGITGSSNISAENKARVLSATVNDIWIEDGKGKQLGNMYKDSIQGGKNASSGNPMLDSMVNARREQLLISQQYQDALKKRQAQVKQQGTKKTSGNSMVKNMVASNNSSSNAFRNNDVAKSSAAKESVCTSKFKGDNVMPRIFLEEARGAFSGHSRKSGMYSALAKKALTQCKSKGAFAVTWMTSESDIKNSVSCDEGQGDTSKYSDKYKYNCTVSAQFYCNCGGGK